MSHIQNNNMDVESLRQTLSTNGQEHLLKYWDTITDEQKTLLYNDLSNVSYPDINKYFAQCMESLEKAGEKVDDHLQPVPQTSIGSVARSDPQTLHKYEQSGLKEISDGTVAVLLLAGGQGTRLGTSYPKGMYDVQLPSHKTLYQLQGERILKVQQLAEKTFGKSGAIPWYIMTSEHTMESTKQFFADHNHFGLKPEDIMCFEQNMLPCLSMDGKIILEKPYKVARAPDGNGGLYRALGNKGVLADIEKRGIKYVHVYCVDNILAKMADPIFVGFCKEKGVCCGAKVVEKVHPTEPVGVICKVDGVYQVVEYSEITMATAEKRNTDGRLMFNNGNICNHFFTVDFLRQVVREREAELLYHVAKKKIPHVGPDMKTIKPTTNNGIKMEKFVFDVFKFASELAVWEVLREDEFSPLKNADGAVKDTPTTSREDLYSLHRRFVLKAGGKFINSDGSAIPDIRNSGDVTNGQKNGDGHQDDAEPFVCEISPLVSYFGEGLESVVKGKSLVPPFILTDPSEKTKSSVNVKQ